MRVVVDTSVVFSLFKSSSFANKILREHKIELFAPKELMNIKPSILKYSKLPLEQLDSTLESLKMRIKITPDGLSKSFEQKARQLAPHDKDIPFFALALKLGCSIWSNDPGFKRQSKIKVFSTQELKKEVSK